MTVNQLLFSLSNIAIRETSGSETTQLFVIWYDRYLVEFSEVVLSHKGPSRLGDILTELYNSSVMNHSIYEFQYRIRHARSIYGRSRLAPMLISLAISVVWLRGTTEYLPLA